MVYSKSIPKRCYEILSWFKVFARSLITGKRDFRKTGTTRPGNNFLTREIVHLVRLREICKISKVTSDSASPVASNGLNRKMGRERKEGEVNKERMELELIFDLGLRSGIIEFWNFKFFNFYDLWQVGHFQNLMFSLLRP